MKPIERLREQYMILLMGIQPLAYSSIKSFCLECNLLTFAEIEAME